MSKIPLAKQAGTLRSYFPNCKITLKGNTELTWIYKLTPSPLSNTYGVRIHYRKGKPINIRVTNPKPLQLAVGHTKLPHVYSHIKQELCLYYPKDNEWDTGKLYVHTLIPWTSEWLFHYEIWVATGKWTGGGIEHNES